VLQRFEAAYVKCVKMLFSLREEIAVFYFCKLGLLTFKTIIHNAKVKMASRLKEQYTYQKCIVLILVVGLL